MGTRDKDGQLLLGDYLRAYGATPVLTEGNLPGGGALFDTCARAVEPEQTEIPRPLQVGDRVRTKAGKIGTVGELGARVLVLIEVPIYTGGSRTDKQWKEPASLVRVDA